MVHGRWVGFVFRAVGLLLSILHGHPVIRSPLMKNWGFALPPVLLASGGPRPPPGLGGGGGMQRRHGSVHVARLTPCVRGRTRPQNNNNYARCTLFNYSIKNKIYSRQYREKLSFFFSLKFESKTQRCTCGLLAINMSAAVPLFSLYHSAVCLGGGLISLIAGS